VNRESLLPRLSGERASVAFDLLLAAGLTALLQLQVWTQEAVDETFADRPLSSPILLVVTVPLIWRRRAPIAVAACCGAGIAAQVVVTGTFTTAIGLVLPVLVALFSAGAYAERPRAFLGLGAILLGVGVHELYEVPSTEADLWNGAFFVLLMLAVFGAGVYVRGRRRSAELERQARRLEREREERARAVVEERARIARELHDVVAHSVSATVIQAEAAEEVLARHPDSARRSLRRIQSTGREALAEMRRLLGIVRGGETSGALSPQPGLEELERLIEAASEDLGVELTIDGERRELPPGIELSAYRIVQEALTNVRRHAGRSAKASVLVHYGETALELEIADDGGGPRSTDGLGHGIVGMRERVAFFGGEFSAGPGDGGGFVVRAHFPLAPVTR
jgi:signal transduction histidine kinase